MTEGSPRTCVHSAAGTSGVLAPGGRESRWPVGLSLPCHYQEEVLPAVLGKEEATQPGVGVGQGHLKSQQAEPGDGHLPHSASGSLERMAAVRMAGTS